MTNKRELSAFGGKVMQPLHLVEVRAMPALSAAEQT